MTAKRHKIFLKMTTKWPVTGLGRWTTPGMIIKMLVTHQPRPVILKIKIIPFWDMRLHQERSMWDNWQVGASIGRRLRAWSVIAGQDDRLSLCNLHKLWNYHGVMNFTFVFYFKNYLNRLTKLIVKFVKKKFKFCDLKKKAKK